MSAPQRTPPGAGDSIARSTGLAALSQLVTAAFTAVLTLYLVRALGPAEYGVFALAVSVSALAMLPADLGISLSAARFIAERRSDHGGASDILRNAFRLKLVVAAVVSLALMAVAGPIADAYGEPGLTWPLRGVALALFGQSSVLFFQRAFIALGRVGIGLRIILSESALEFTASITLVLLGAGAAGAAFGRATGYLLGALIAVALTARTLGRRALPGGGPATEGLRSIAGYAGALFVIDGAYTLFREIDVLLIGAFLGTAAVGVFEAPMRLVTFLHYPGLAVANGVAPRLSRGAGQEPNLRALENALRGLIVLQAALIAPVLVWAEPIVRLLLGPEYAESATVLRALTPFVFLSGLAPLVALGANFLGEARRRIPLAFAAVAVNAGVDLLLIPRVGVVAGAIGSSLAYLVYVPAHFLILRRMLDLSLRPLALTLARSLVAACAMAGVLAATGTGQVSLVAMLLGLLGGGIAFLGALLLLGEVTRTDARAVRRTLLRRRSGDPA